jgi:hypothetical protein
MMPWIVGSSLRFRRLALEVSPLSFLEGSSPGTGGFIDTANQRLQERMDGYALSLQNHDMRATESDIAWIDELITNERTEIRPNTQPN